MRRRRILPGLIAGLALCAAMYVASALTGMRTLPDLALQSLTPVIPGTVFAFLVGMLQHGAKVAFEAGSLVVMVVACAAIGSLYPALRRSSVGHGAPVVLGAASWLAITVVVLPLFGDGLVGLDEGVKAPLIWAVLFAVYAGVLEVGFQGFGRDTDFDIERRRTLRLLTFGIGGLALGGLALRLVPGWYGSIFAPPEDRLVGEPPRITPIDDFYVVSKNLVDPVVAEPSWRLTIDGLCDKPMTLGLEDVHRLPNVTEDITLECVSNKVGGRLMSTGAFTGVRLLDVLDLVQPQTSASYIAFTATDGYMESLSLSVVKALPEILVAYELDGAPLPNEHGFPARIVVPGHYGFKSPKWLTTIRLTSMATGSYYESQGWNPQGVVQTTARFDVPDPNAATASVGTVPLAGIAFAGTRGISTVQWTDDNGTTWRNATIEAPLSPYTWVRWTSTWTVRHKGVYILMARARDGTGALQTPVAMADYPSGATGYHTILVDVT
jgi:DMSO/TMAO reductase YedYZ molybdopterin-dependent catalytic subunit